MALVTGPVRDWNLGSVGRCELELELKLPDISWYPALEAVTS